MKLKDSLKGLICFWCWVGVILLTFMLVIMAAIGLLVRPAVFVIALVIFVASLAVVIFNPGWLARVTTAATGQ